MDELSGSTVGPYTIEREIGRGGMGVVYLGRDTTLDRAVAIKALPEHLAEDPERLARFEREAKTLAQLSHPNVAGIYGVEEQDGQRFLVLEYVEGETLADLLDRGAMPVDESIEVCAQIASGVEAAHEAGVIHRDLKPANIKITPDGAVKVLDFGLAKSTESQSSMSGSSQIATVTSPHSPTTPGVILGTAPYMSPEQARGRSVDKRSDIWSFGVILYECLTGAGPFVGETATDSIGAILHKDVDLNALPAQTPGMVRHVLRRCLERDRNRRLRDIGDARVELEHAREHGSEPDSQRDARRGPALLIGVLCVALVAALGWGVLMTTSPTPPRSAGVIHASVIPPKDVRITAAGDLAGPAVVSPDGTKIAFCAAREGQRRRLWLRTISEAEARELPGTEGALFPFWEPGGREIGFFTTDSLRRFDLVSETTQRICAANQGRGGSWTDDGRIVFSPNFRGPLSIVDASGGEPAPITSMDAELHTSHRWPFVVLGTNRFLFSAVSARSGQADTNGIYLATLDSDAEPIRLMASDYRAEYWDGFLLHVRDSVLLASALDLDSGTIAQSPSVLARGIASDLSTWHGQFSASAGGVLVYSPVSGEHGAAERTAGRSWAVEGDRVTSYGYDGRLRTSYAIGMPMRRMALSPDGMTLAMDVVSSDGFLDIWLHPTAFMYDPDEEEAHRARIRAAVIEPEPQRLTFLEGAEIEPTWSPTSDEVAFRWEGSGQRPAGIYRKRIGGGTEVLVLDRADLNAYPADWSPDGEYLIAVSDTVLASEANDIWAIPLDGSERIVLVDDPGSDILPAVSPDGRWLAYNKTAGGSDVYVVPFAPAWPEAQRGRRWLVSEAGGIEPRWSKEGDELYYVTGSGLLMAVSVELDGDSFVFSTPRALFQSPWDTGRSYDISPKRVDARGDFFFVSSEESGDAPISMIVNWRSLLGEPAR